MNLRKWSAIFLLLTLLTLIVPAAATESETPAENPETTEAPAENDTPTYDREGFVVKRYVDYTEIFNTLPNSAMLIDLNSGVTLYEWDSYEQNYPASLTKIMTCWLALEHGNLNDVLTVSETALQNLHESGSTSGLQQGEQMRLEDMLYCMMLESANESCNVVAEYISGDVASFVELMNQTAAELGCIGTHFANPHGLHDENHYTTAYDISLIVRAALQNEDFVRISSAATYDLPATNLQEGRQLSTTNKLLVDSIGSGYFYSKASGIKTGFTTPAQCCLVSTADDGNLKLLCIIMGAPLIQDEHENWVYRNFPEAINMFEFGFNHYNISTVMSTLYPVAEVTVNQSAGAQTVALAPTSEVRTIIDENYDPKEIILDVSLPSTSVDAPVEAGDVLGSVTVSYQGMILGHSELAAITSIERSEITHKAETTKAYVQGHWWKWLVGILLGAAALFAAYIVAIQVIRRQQRKRKVAARRRALEQQRRKQQFRDVWHE